MIKHLNDEFESFMKIENRDFMRFNDPDCKWMEKSLDVVPFMKNSGSILRTPEDVFGVCREVNNEN